jgi:hypothetical protein
VPTQPEQPPRRRARVQLWPRPLKVGCVQIDLGGDEAGHAEPTEGTCTTCTGFRGDFDVPVLHPASAASTVGVASTSGTTGMTTAAAAGTTGAGRRNTWPCLGGVTADVDHWAGLASAQRLPRCQSEDFGDTQPPSPVTNDPYWLVQLDASFAQGPWAIACCRTGEPARE